MNNLDPYVSAIETNIGVTKGEIYRLQNSKVKKAGLLARKALMTIIKSAHAMRRLIQEEVAQMPIVKKNISPEQLREMAAKRQKTFDEKKAKRAAAKLAAKK